MEPTCKRLVGVWVRGYFLDSSTCERCMGSSRRSLISLVYLWLDQLAEDCETNTTVVVYHYQQLRLWLG